MSYNQIDDVIKEGSVQLIEGDFTNAGAASSELKNVLKELGVNENIIRRAAISSFEAEMNVIIHGVAGTLFYSITKDEIRITVTDIGPGIPDIELAMQEGYSTAPDWVREMGWGAGMGLPNIKKNADVFTIDSTVGEGTTLEMKFFLTERAK
ncbi:MAG: ATP-binding protein [Thermodesulfovibrionales bacterium]|nr:ATP-binding protein [Thermodesulfovibrionales bacterium]